MAVDLDDPKMEGFTPLQTYRDMDVSSSSRRIREDSDMGPLTEAEVKTLLEKKLDLVVSLADFPDCANDAAAALAEVPVGGFYRTGSIWKVRIA